MTDELMHLLDKAHGFAKNDEPIIAFSIQPQQTVLMSQAFAKSAPNITLEIGYENIAKQYFHHEPPTADELEYAINTIEDEIAKVTHQVPSGLFVCQDKAIIHLAKLSGVTTEPMQLPRTQLESLFSQYAEIITGRPARERDGETDVSAIFYARLLILREMMHHLKFSQLLCLG
ncbi:hypothetical protein [Celerinatantimonas sp. MCCC 1A17872]|uniref:hypothetical protein n=1 Tax=Celerinatantimonas sp. MCCC 1A17872 TaxID=3177514 RepID=UPI0038BEB81D